MVSTWQRHHDSLSPEHDAAAWETLKQIAQAHSGVAVLSQGDGLWRAWTQEGLAYGGSPQEAVLALAAKLQAGAEPNEPDAVYEQPNNGDGRFLYGQAGAEPSEEG